MGFEEMSPSISGNTCNLEGRDIIGQAQTGTGKTAASGYQLLKMQLEKKHVQPWSYAQLGSFHPGC